MRSDVKRMFCAAAGLMMAVASASGADADPNLGVHDGQCRRVCRAQGRHRGGRGSADSGDCQRSGTGLKDLVEGRADVAMLSSVLAKVAEKANIDPKGLNQFPLVDGKLVFIVHSGNPVKSLTLEQVKGALAGTIKNWKELGGPYLAIVPVVEAVGGGVRMLTEEGVMHGAAIDADAKAVKGDKIAGLVKTTPGALGVASSQHNTTGAVALTTDKAVPQMLVLVVKGAASPAIQKLVAAAVPQPNRNIGRISTGRSAAPGVRPTRLHAAD